MRDRDPEGHIFSTGIDARVHPRLVCMCICVRAPRFSMPVPRAPLDRTNTGEDAATIDGSIFLKATTSVAFSQSFVRI